ncbi:MAG: hypothetical protein RL339_1450 [Pseudomonadota bacterium]|jgi:hypothetical protein
MATAAAAVVAKARREIQHHFFSADAVRADRAVAFTPSGFAEARQFAKMLEAGIIRQADGDRYWIDVVTYDIAIQGRYRRVRTILVTLVIVLAAALIYLEASGAA